MPELTIPVGQNIGPDYIDWDTWEFVPGFTVDTIRMQLEYAAYQGVPVDSILLQFGICYGGSTRHAMDIHNYLRGLAIPVRAHVLSITASAGTVVALAADEIELEHTAQWMVHRPMFVDGSQSQRSEDIRADADRLDREEQQMVDLYVASTGQTEEDVRALIAVDRFMTATEALDFGFATKVNPLRGKAPAPAAVQARLRTARQAVARADRQHLRTAQARAPKPRSKTAARAAAPSPRPMAKKVVKPAGSKPAAPQNRSSLTAAQKTAAQAIQALAKAAGIKATVEGLEVAEVEAELVTTAVDGGNLYSDGELAQGVAVYTDEALTTAAEDGVYDAEDGREITVTSGVVESIVEAEAETEDTSTATITAAVTAALAPLTARLDTMEAKFNATTPPTPRPRAAAGQAADPKGGNKPKPKAAHHSQL